MPHFTLTADRTSREDMQKAIDKHGNITPEFFERDSVCVEAESSVIEAFSKANPSWTSFELASLKVDVNAEKNDPAKLPVISANAGDRLIASKPKKFWSKFGL